MLNRWPIGRNLVPKHVLTFSEAGDVLRAAVSQRRAASLTTTNRSLPRLRLAKVQLEAAFGKRSGGVYVVAMITPARRPAILDIGKAGGLRSGRVIDQGVAGRLLKKQTSIPTLVALAGIETTSRRKLWPHIARRVNPSRPVVRFDAWLCWPPASILPRFAESAALQHYWRRFQRLPLLNSDG